MSYFKWNFFESCGCNKLWFKTCLPKRFKNQNKQKCVMIDFLKIYGSVFNISQLKLHSTTHFKIHPAWGTRFLNVVQIFRSHTRLLQALQQALQTLSVRCLLLIYASCCHALMQSYSVMPTEYLKYLRDSELHNTLHDLHSAAVQCVTRTCRYRRKSNYCKQFKS